MDSDSFQKKVNESYDDMNNINNINNNNQSNKNKNIFNNNNLTLDRTVKFYVMMKNPKIDAWTQTNYKLLYQKEEKKEKDKNEDNEENKEIVNNKQKKRKDDADLMRDKIFKYFNKMVYNWIKNTKNNNDKINIYHFIFKNNKTTINECMNKQLKNLFLKEIDGKLDQKLKQINNNLLIKKLEYKYEDIYKLFISQKEKINKSEELLKDFYFLDDFLEELKKKKEDDEYLSRLKEVALHYDKWKDKKTHLWGKKK